MTKVVSAIKAGRAYPFIGVLTSLPKHEPSFQGRQVVTENVLQELAMRTDYIIVGAYDNENELIWVTPSPIAAQEEW